ncbi:hypothetical protein [Thiocystis minor]|uniref:hypothetical protein n=1 Tax=Thiocystis minor TaxID=61597 RepID=UPI003B835356
MREQIIADQWQVFIHGGDDILIARDDGDIETKKTHRTGRRDIDRHRFERMVDQRRLFRWLGRRVLGNRFGFGSMRLFHALGRLGSISEQEIIGSATSRGEDQQDNEDQDHPLEPVAGALARFRFSRFLGHVSP